MMANCFQQRFFLSSFHEIFNGILKQCCIGLALLFLLLLSKTTGAQAVKSGFITYGVITGLGNSDRNTVNRYQPVYFGGDFSLSLGKAKKRDFISYYMEPQFNIVYTSQKTDRIDFEFGLNAGFRNYIRINPDFYLYQMVGAGPHYISAIITKQANGFIFSDNIAIGLLKKINNKSVFLNLQFRLRHISNAGLKEPNQGVNSYIFIVGLSKVK